MNHMPCLIALYGLGVRGIAQAILLNCDPLLQDMHHLCMRKSTSSCYLKYQETHAMWRVETQGIQCIPFCGVCPCGVKFLRTDVLLRMMCPGGSCSATECERELFT